MVKALILTRSNLVIPDNIVVDPTGNGAITENADFPLNSSVPYSRYQYNFIEGSIMLKNKQLAVGSVNIWFSWYNITGKYDNSQYNNNTLYYRWVDGTLYKIEYPSGNYTFDSLNCYIQWTMINNTHYLINADGNYVFFIELLRNPSYYTCNLNVYPVPSTLGTYTMPSGATWSLPASDETPIVYIPWFDDYTSVVNGTTTSGSDEVTNVSSVANIDTGYTIMGTNIPSGTTITAIDDSISTNLKLTMSANATGSGTSSITISTGEFTYAEVLEMEALGNLYSNWGKSIGFTPGKYPSTAESTAQSYNSDLVSVLDRVNALNITCNIVRNSYTLPPRLLYSFSFPKDTYDSLISHQAAEYAWVDIIDGQYNSLTLDFYDQFGDSVAIKDPNLVIYLLIKDKDEEVTKNPYR